jgi:hypothetical protein
MKNILTGTILLVLMIIAPVQAMAGVNVNIGVSLPPPIVFHAPPDVVVLPDSQDVYVVPDLDIDLFFWNGWWWRLWSGQWYWSHYYDRGWTYYGYVPSFYSHVDPYWRGYYKNHNWYGYRWDYERIPHQQLQRSWSTWHSNSYWENQRHWGIQGYQGRPQGQRYEPYQPRPDFRQPQHQPQWSQQPNQRYEPYKESLGYKQPPQQYVQPMVQQQRREPYQQRPDVRQQQGPQQQQVQQPQLQRPQSQPQVQQPRGQQPIQHVQPQPNSQQPPARKLQDGQGNPHDRAQQPQDQQAPFHGSQDGPGRGDGGHRK